MSFRFEHRLEQRQQLSPKQKLELKGLLQLRHEFHSPPPPEAVRGLAGVGVSNEMLTQKGLRGILIGGVAVDFWKGSIGPDQLAAHKDVDVMVLPDDSRSGQLMEQFEGGVDWWLSQSAKMDVRSLATQTYGRDVTWWENGNGVELGFTALTGRHALEQLPNGLLVPTPDWLVDMQEVETLSRVDSRVAGHDPAFFAALRAKLSASTNPKKVGGTGLLTLSQAVAYRYQFGPNKLAQKEDLINLPLETLELEDLRAIRKHKEAGHTTEESR